MTHVISLLTLSSLSEADPDPLIPRRDRLIRGLAAVIERSGYRDSKIRDVAAAAHVSLRSFYEEFSSKDEILFELDTVLRERMLHTVRALVVFDGPFDAVVRRAFRGCIAELLSAPNLTRAMLVDLATLGDEARRTREDGLQAFAALLCDLVDEGRAAYPDLPSTALHPFMARSIVGAVAELATSRGALDTDTDPSVFADTMTDLLLSVVGAS